MTPDEKILELLKEKKFVSFADFLLWVDQNREIKGMKAAMKHMVAEGKVAEDYQRSGYCLPE